MGRDKYPVAHKDNPSVFSDSAVAESKDHARDNPKDKAREARDPHSNLITKECRKGSAGHGRSNQQSAQLRSHKAADAKET